MRDTGIKNNSGFSLVELIVAMLITSVVSLGVMAFVSLATREYTTTNSEVGIQMESSAAEDFITKSIREATDYKIIPADDDPNKDAYDYRALFIRGAEVEKGKYKISVFVCYPEKKLLLYNSEIAEKVSYYTSDSLNLDSLTGAGKMIPNMIANPKQYLLANYVEDFKVTEDTYEGTTKEDDNKVLDLEISYKYGSKAFSHTFKVKVRNDI